MQLYGTISSNSREAGLRVVVGESLSINRVGKLEGRIAGSRTYTNTFQTLHK